jgi:hypothetical protein
MTAITSKVETPQEAPLASISEVARKLEALRNDIPPEKLAEAQLKADFGRLEGKIETVTKARKASVEELTQINLDFEKLKQSLKIQQFLEIQQFEEKFAASEAIIRYLKANPKVKPEDVKPSDIKITNPELQKPAVWKNIVEDAMKGLAVANLFEQKDFDWKNPKAYLEKAGKVGNSIIETANAHPFASAVVLIGGIYALCKLYEGIKEKDGWEIAKGALVGSGAVWLGMSLVNADKETLARKLLGNKNVDKAKNKAADKANEKAGNIIRGGKEAISLPEYDAHTDKYYEIIKGKSVEEAITYKALREHLKDPAWLNRVTMREADVMADLEKMENGEMLGEKKNTYYWGFIFNRVVMEVTDWGITAATLGGYFVFRISKETCVFYKNLMSFIFQRNIDSWAELTKHYAINAAYVTGVSTAVAYLKNAGKHGAISLPRAMLKGGIDGMRWPVYVTKIAGETIQAGAEKALNSRLLGSWVWQKNVWHFVDTAGKTLAKFNPIKAIFYLFDGGKWVTQKTLTAATQATAEIVATEKMNPVTETSAAAKSKPGRVIQGNFGREKAIPEATVVEGNTVRVLKPRAETAEVIQPTTLLKEAQAAKVETLPEKAYEKYAGAMKAKGRTPMAFEEISTKFKSVARVGGEALRVLGAVGVCVLIHNVSEATDKRKALVQTGAELAVFMGAMRLTPGHPLLKLLGGIAATVGYTLLPQEWVEPIQSKTAEMMPAWINHPVAEAYWDSFSYWTGGGAISMISNKLSTGFDSQEFLNRSMPWMYGDWHNPLSWQPGKMKLNNVADWNKRNADEMLSISQKMITLAKEKSAANPKRQKEIAEEMQKLEAEFKMRESLRVDTAWDKRKATELLMAKAAVVDKKTEIEAMTQSISEADRKIAKEFLEGKVIEESRRIRNPGILKDLLAKVQNPALKTALEEYAGVRIGYEAELDFVKSIGRYNADWEKPNWALDLPED